MAEDLQVLHTASKEGKYKLLLRQVQVLLSGETDKVANMANMVAALKQTFDFFWIGFYVVKAEELVLAPFQGPVACTRIGYGRGVCGAAWQRAQTLVVPNVELFPGHIACSSLSKSEIVIPVIRDSKVVAVLDVDSDELNNFDEIDSLYLNELVKLLSFD